MTRHITLKELRPKLPAVVDGIDGRMERYVVTRRGKPVVMMMGVDDYEAMLETIEVLSDKKLMKSIRSGEADIHKGRVISLSDLTAKIEKKRGKKIPR